MFIITSVSTCFEHHYAHLQENKGPVTAFGVLFWFCWTRLTTLPPSCAVVMQSGDLNFLEPSGHLGLVMGLICLFI